MEADMADEMNNQAQADMFAAHHSNRHDGAGRTFSPELSTPDFFEP